MTTPPIREAAPASGWRPGRLAKNTLIATGWQGIRLLLQFAYLVLVARVLGVEGYGLFSGCVALAASLSPLVGWGFSMILLQEVSRSPARFPQFWAKAIWATIISGPLMVGTLLAIAPLLLPIDSHWTVIILVAAAELLAMPLITAGSVAHQAHERLGRTIFNHVQLNFIRLGVVVLLSLMGKHELITFAWAYFIATTMVALLSLLQVHLTYAPPDWSQRSLAGRMREGFGFSFSLVAITAQGEIDKTLLLRLDSATAAGNYSVASRIASAATIPLISYVLAAMPRLFREGECGTTIVLARRLLPPVVIYGIGAGFAMVFFGPMLPILFGDSFTETSHLIRWLAPLPLLTGVAFLSLNVLSASGFQRTRALIENSVLIINIVLNVLLIPSIGVLGSVIAMLVSQSILAALPAIVMAQIKNRESQ